MKLQNRKTGEILEDVKYIDTSLTTIEILYLDNGVLRIKSEKDYHSFLQNWKDYEQPKEPLIKDKKICKAVRAWAEANEVLEVFIDRIGDGTYIELYDEDDGRRRISALRPAGLKIGEAYTIDELCGEEEE